MRQLGLEEVDAATELLRGDTKPRSDIPLNLVVLQSDDVHSHTHVVDNLHTIALAVGKPLVEA